MMDSHQNMPETRSVTPPCHAWSVHRIQLNRLRWLRTEVWKPGGAMALGWRHISGVGTKSTSK